ncbi:MAG: ABC transporter permease [Methyloligellaceae bacterium]
MAFSNLSLALRMALRELRGGLRGFYIFVSCIALGVAAIVAVGALADAFDSGISQRGQEILGGDIALSRIHERASQEVLSDFSSYGQVSEVATARAMTRTIDNQYQALVEVKAVDNLYPLYGQLMVKGDRAGKLSGELTGFADATLFDRFGLKPGDKIRLGSKLVVLQEIIADEPDRLSTGNTLGPRLLISISTFEKAGLVQPGSLIRWRYRIKLKPGVADEDSQLEVLSERLEKQYSDSGFYVLNRLRPTPGISTAIGRLGMFLTLVGLTALIIGGVGVGNAVNTFIEGKRSTIATFKSLGAQNSLIFRIYLIQILIISGIGIILGVVLGLAAPMGIGFFLGEALPVKMSFTPEVSTVFMGVFYGFLVSLLFVILPLRRSRDVRPQMLFREEATGETGKITRGDIIIAGALALLLIAVAISLSRAELFSLYFCAGLTVIFGVFIFYGRLVQALAHRLPGFKGAALVVARANVTGPGSFARTIILSLGLGLSLLVTVSLIDVSLVRQLQSGLPENAPSHFFVDIRKDQYPGFATLVRKYDQNAHLSQAPMLRGRIVKLAGVDSANVVAADNAKWALNGDRGITYSDEVPRGSEVVEGRWWSAGHSGDNLVSFEQSLAKGLGLKIGDEIVVNVLGRDITAKIANFRTLKWESLRINFVMVFSPNTLAGAPANMLATLRPEGSGEIKGEGNLMRDLAKQYPNITAIRVKDAIETVSGIYERIMMAIRVAGGLTLVAGALVLAGALATAQQRRKYESAIFKSLGATRRQIISAHIIEYLGLSVATGALALILGGIAAWSVLVFVLRVEFVFSIQAALLAIGFSVVLVLFFGIIGSWRVLSAKTAPYLRGR